MMIYSVMSIVVFVVALLISMFRVLREYERGVVFFLGRFYQVKGPGLVILIPVIQQMVRVDLRTIVLDVPTQDLITRDNVSVKVNAVVYFRVVDPKMAINNVESYLEANGTTVQEIKDYVKNPVDRGQRSQATSSHFARKLIDKEIKLIENI